jgi:hypothetical protein
MIQNIDINAMLPTLGERKCLVVSLVKPAGTGTE